MRGRAHGALPGRGGARAPCRRGRRPLTIPWDLELGEPFEARHSQLVAPGRLEDGTEVVVKVQLAGDFEAIREPEALCCWDGHGAVRLLAHDPERNALLLERCLPGTPLGAAYDEEALAVAAGLMERLWRDPPPEVDWPRLDDVAARWTRELPGRYPGGLADEALEAIAALTPIEDAVLCHQDLHGGNILRAEREPWLAIDPKPIVAERAYDTVAIVRDAKPTPVELRRRLDVLSELLGLDRERMRLWGLVKALAWDNPDEAQLFSEVGSG